MTRSKRRGEHVPPSERCFDCDLPITATRVAIELDGVRTYFHAGCHPAWERRQAFKPGKAPRIVPLDPKAELARVLGFGDGERVAPLHEAIASSHPKLARGRVWCTTCGASAIVDPAHCLYSSMGTKGWPRCCGQTMTIDSPEERGEQRDLFGHDPDEPTPAERRRARRFR